ncbi:MAG: hypothetical protein N2595_02790 [bacterium]|nr:hypothetical protein [bacterium]
MSKSAMNGATPDAERVRHLPWEERNLGRPSYELNCSNLLAEEALAVRERFRALEMAGPIFVQARVEHQDTRIHQMLTQLGFVPIEATIDPYCVLSRNEVVARYVSDPQAFLPRRFSENEVEVAELDRQDGTQTKAVLAVAEESFVADRFHVDHRCPDHLAGRRYRLWTEDLLRDKEVSFVMLVVRGSVAGFFAYKGEHLILAGLSRLYAGSGLGDYFWLGVLQRIRGTGIESVHTRISVNNVPVMNLYARLGFKFRNPAMVFHYWSEAAH